MTKVLSFVGQILLLLSLLLYSGHSKVSLESNYMPILSLITLALLNSIANQLYQKSQVVSDADTASDSPLNGKLRKE